MNIEALTSVKPASLDQDARSIDTSAADKEKLRKVCDQFESILLREVLQEGMKPMLAKPPGSSAAGGGVYDYMATDALANGISGANGMGISNLLQAQLTSKWSAGETTTEAP